MSQYRFIVVCVGAQVVVALGAAAFCFSDPRAAYPCLVLAGLWLMWLAVFGRSFWRLQ